MQANAETALRLPAFSLSLLAPYLPFNSQLLTSRFFPRSLLLAPGSLLLAQRRDDRPTRAPFCPKLSHSVACICALAKHVKLPSEMLALSGQRTLFMVNYGLFLRVGHHRARALPTCTRLKKCKRSPALNIGCPSPRAAKKTALISFFLLRPLRDQRSVMGDQSSFISYSLLPFQLLTSKLLTPCFPPSSLFPAFSPPFPARSAKSVQI